MAKVRLDQLMLALAHADTRAKAQALIVTGSVYVGGVKLDKPGTLVAEDAALEVRGSRNPYVSRGGLKLEAAIVALGVQVAGRRCLDVGASTGGFTDCLLARGATQVVAVDVGYGQLAYKLRIDPRVVVMERTNARALEPAQIGGTVALTVVDASFIGLSQLAEAIARCTQPDGELLALVKPQFEVGRAEASRGKGVIRDPQTRRRAIDQAAASLAASGFVVLDQCDSAVPGPKGNIEAFVWARRAKAE